MEPAVEQPTAIRTAVSIPPVFSRPDKDHDVIFHSTKKIFVTPQNTKRFYNFILAMSTIYIYIGGKETEWGKRLTGTNLLRCLVPLWKPNAPRHELLESCIHWNRFNLRRITDHEDIVAKMRGRLHREPQKTELSHASQAGKERGDMARGSSRNASDKELTHSLRYWERILLNPWRKWAWIWMTQVNPKYWNLSH